ncbi:MAG: TonB-dependent receptor, partial [Acidobacteriota bacterium]
MIGSILRSNSLLPYLGLAVILCLTMLPCEVQAQVLYGSIVGNVTDQTGGTVPGADVSVTNQNTNRVQSAITNQLGAYSFTTLIPGSYTLKVTMPGFREYVETDVLVTVNNVARHNVALQIGQVSETITVTSETAILQTDRAEVRAEIAEEGLENLPVPLGRNYQELFKTLPGFAPPRREHSIQTNPSRSRSFNANGVSDSINTTRIDGITTTNPWLPHITGYVPSLDAIETVNVVSNSFDAEQGLAGGAAVTVRMKSGTNQFHGSAFFVHHSNAMRAQRFLYPYPEGLRTGKYIYNQWGGSLGGPIVKDKLFFFASYEGTANRRFSNRIGSVPTQGVRDGNFDSLDVTVYDPLTGNPDASGRTPFPNNTIPLDRMDPINQTVLAKLPLPNISNRLGEESNNYLGEGSFVWDRWTLDTKVDWVISDSLNMFGRFSALDYSLEQPTIFGNDNLMGSALSGFGFEGGNPGVGSGTTYTLGLGLNYVVSPSFIIDGNFGYADFTTDSRNPFLDQNVGLDLGIPGTNGSEWWQGGYPFWDLEGYNDFGTTDSFMPYLRDDRNIQYTGNFNWTSGNHNVRFGFDISQQHMNHVQPEGGVGQGARGRFRFDRDLTRGCLDNGDGTCSLSDSTSRQSFAALLLGMPTRIGKQFLTDPLPYTTRNNLLGFYVRDRWQVTPNFTLSIGTRWEYYPMPTRAHRGMERYDALTNTVDVCGIGQVPKDCGVSMSKSLFAPRIGFAYRITDTFVFRAGYGITIDPYPLARDLRTNYPMFIENDVRETNDWIPVIGSMSEGIPEIVVPDLGNGVIDIPGDVFAHTFLLNFKRGYIQSWNITLQKELFAGITGEAGYVANNFVRGMGRRDLNWGPLGGGRDGQQLVDAFGRTAGTNATDNAGHTRYNSLQTRLMRRFSSGYAVGASYTWSKAMASGFEGDDSDSSLKIDIPELFDLNRQVSIIDRTHNFQLTNIWELPFGPGQKFLNDGGVMSHILGGWQVNNIISWYSGTPFDIGGGQSTNCGSGCTGRADLVGTIQKLGGRGPGDPFYNPSAFAEPEDNTIGTAAFGILRSPRTFNWDFSVFRDFGITEELTMKFTAEFFNFTNHPQFGPDNDAFASDDVDDDDFLEIDEGVNERVVRLGLR